MQTPLPRQILYKPHAVVFEDDFAFLLGGVQIHIGFDAEVAGAVLVEEDLAHVPEVRVLLRTLVDGQVGRAARIAIDADLAVLGEVVVQGCVPGALGKAPVLVQAAQLAGALERCQAHA